jgi:hypothetical protein
VAKRLDAPYAVGRRSTSWVKQKHRRRERFVATGWRERDGALPEFFLARRVGKELRPAGTASLGLDPERREQLLSALAAAGAGAPGAGDDASAGRYRRSRSWLMFTGRPTGRSATPRCARSASPGLSEVHRALASDSLFAGSQGRRSRAMVAVEQPGEG